MTQEQQRKWLPRINERWALGGAGATAIGVIVGAMVLSSQSAAVDWSQAPDPSPARAGTASAQGPKAALAVTPAALTQAAPVNEVRGIIKAQEEATIASRITARITAMPYREGQSFGRGALLARFDCSQTQAQLQAAVAATAAYRKTYETNAELDAYKAIGTNEVAVSRANLGKASAEADAIRAGLSDCAVYAPFAGVVTEEIGHAQEVAASGQPLLKIQSGGSLEIELIVPSRWLSWLKPGEPFAFRIDETGQQVQGTVTKYGATVDAVSKTLRVTGRIDQSNGLVLPGMSGSAMFPGMEKAVAAAAAGNTDGKQS